MHAPEGQRGRQIGARSIEPERCDARKRGAVTGGRRPLRSVRTVTKPIRCSSRCAPAQKLYWVSPPGTSSRFDRNRWPVRSAVGARLNPAEIGARAARRRGAMGDARVPQTSSPAGRRKRSAADRSQAAPRRQTRVGRLPERKGRDAAGPQRRGLRSRPGIARSPARGRAVADVEPPTTGTRSCQAGSHSRDDCSGCPGTRDATASNSHHRWHEPNSCSRPTSHRGRSRSTVLCSSVRRCWDGK